MKTNNKLKKSEAETIILFALRRWFLLHNKLLDGTRRVCWQNWHLANKAGHCQWCNSKFQGMSAFSRWIAQRSGTDWNRSRRHKRWIRRKIFGRFSSPWWWFRSRWKCARASWVRISFHRSPKPFLIGHSANIPRFNPIVESAATGHTTCSDIPNRISFIFE